MREIQSGEYGCKIQLIKYNYAHNSKSTVATNLITIVTAHKDAPATERKEAHSNHPLLLPFIIMERDKICRIKRNLLTIEAVHQATLACITRQVISGDRKVLISF